MNDPFANPDITRGLNGVRARDAFVIVAIVLVTAALGFGAFLQFDVGVLPSLIVSALVFASLISTHLLVVRSQAVGTLNAEVARLNAELANTRQLVAQGSARPAAPPAHREPVRTHPQSLARPSPPDAYGYPNLESAPPHGGATPYPNPYAPQDDQASPPGVMPEHFGQIVAEFAAAQHRRPAPPPLPQNRPSASTATPMAETPPAAPAQRAAQPEPTNPRAPSPDRVSRALSPKAGRPPSVIPNGDPDAPASASEPDEEATTAIDMDREMESLARSHPTEEIAEGQPEQSGTDPTGPIVPQSRDLEVMQRLIEQLSAQLNAPQAAAPARAQPPMPPPIDQAKGAPPGASPSAETGAAPDPIAALKAAKDEMQAALQPDRTPDRRHADRRQGDRQQTPRDQDNRRQGDRRAASAPPVPPIAERTPAPTPKSAPAAPPPAAATPPAAKPLQSYSRLAEVAEAVASDRIALFLEPIAALESRKPRHFEVSAKLRSSTDEMIDDDEYTPLSVGSGLLARIDAKKLAGAAQIAERLDRRGTKGTLFSGLSGESLADNMFLDVFADLFTADNTLSHRLVITFAQADVRAFADAHWVVLSEMAEIGFRFALETVADLDMDFEYLKSIGFDFVKLDAAVFLDGMPIGEDMVPSADICRFLADVGMTLIVDAIDNEKQLGKVMGFGVLFGQGTLFGGPRLIEMEQSAAA